MYLEDLTDGKIKEKVNSIASKIDTWGNQIRYSKSLMSNRSAVSEVIAVCKELVLIAEKKQPEEYMPAKEALHP